MEGVITTQRPKNLACRLWLYQAERFPVLAHGALIVAFSFCGVALSCRLRGALELPPFSVFATAAIVSFLFFLQLRIADEFKDHADDCKWRPYRPVPRGLVSLGELKKVAFAAALTQLALTFSLNPCLLCFLFAAWCYLGLTTKEFFASKWLRSHPVTYLSSHMLILPFIDAYITACDWVTATAPPPAALCWFLIVSFFNGMVIEIGRKIRAAEQEEPGVETYSLLWGPRKAASIWLLMLTVTASFAALTARATGFLSLTTPLLALLLIAGCCIAVLFRADPSIARSANFERFSGLWTLSMYLLLGAAPFLLKP